MEIKELGHTAFYVSNLERSANFYRDLLGFTEITRHGWYALFSSGRTHHELLLIEVGGVPKTKDHLSPGFYHAGFKIGDTDEELLSAYRELKAAGATIVGSADHTVTHSLYIEDPDGNELELYVDVTDVWKHDPTAIMAPVRPLALDLEQK
jgi:catechol 2,3-dioxygenase